jgi:hypothetical protein
VNIAFVAQRHQDKQLFVNILTAGEAQPLQRRDPGVITTKSASLPGWKLPIFSSSRRARAPPSVAW